VPVLTGHRDRWSRRIGRNLKYADIHAAPLFRKKINAQAWWEGCHTLGGSPLTSRPEDLFWLTVSAHLSADRFGERGAVLGDAV